MYRVAQWATGSMGRTALRRIIDHPDLELVGVYVYDPRKVGRDAGELARRPSTGVAATNRIADIVASKPDVVLHTPRLTEPYSRQNDDVIELLGAGIDVISTAGFHYPDCHGVAYAGPLRHACERGGSTLAGLGLNPGFIAERVAVLLTGMCADLTSVACYEIADASSMPAPEFVFGIMGFGTDPAVRDITHGPLAALYGELFMEVFHAVAAALGTRVLRLEPEHKVTLAPHDLAIKAGTVRAGTVAATEWRWRGELADGRVLVHSVTWTADPRLQGGNSREAAHWRIEIDGRPNVRVSIIIEDPDPTAPHMRAAADATVALALRAIPEVCAAPPGFYQPPPEFGFRARLVAPASS
jgi:2,4-diaminopentanoate dehydrogenase